MRKYNGTCGKCGAPLIEGKCTPCKNKYLSEYHNKNREKILAKKSEYKKANPGKCKIHAHNYRARKNKNTGILSIGIEGKLFVLQKGRCACCGKPLGENYHMDHRIPLARGGLNSDENMQLLTKRCNLQKNAKDPIDFMQERGYLL